MSNDQVPGGETELGGRLQLVDDSLRVAAVEPFRRLRRSDPWRSKLKEADYDRLVLNCSLTIQDALRNAGVIGPTARLVCLGRQVKHIDVLYVEVEGNDPENEEVTRVVIFEDKLLNNPDQRRSVVGQIFEYAQTLVESAQKVESVRTFRGEDAEVDEHWLTSRETEIARVLRRKEFLYVICGDEFDSRLVQLVKHSFGSGDDPTWKHDVSLLSLELYRRGHDSHVLVVPRVVPVLHGAQRRVDVNVRVLDSHDDEVEVEIRAEQGVASAKPVRSEDEFLSLKLPQSARAVREILTAIRAASIPGMDETRYVSGQPTFRIRGYSVLTVSPGQKALASNIQKAYLKGSDAGDPLASAAEAFQKRLKAIEGSTSTSTGRVLIPPEKALRNVEAIVDALQRLAEALSTVEPGTAQDES